MKRYHYVNLCIDGFFGSGSEEHRKIIDQQAAEGWLYVGYIPTCINSHGRVTHIDLIFEADSRE